MVEKESRTNQAQRENNDEYADALKSAMDMINELPREGGRSGSDRRSRKDRRVK